MSASCAAGDQGSPGAEAAARAVRARPRRNRTPRARRGFGRSQDQRVVVEIGVGRDVDLAVAEDETRTEIAIAAAAAALRTGTPGVRPCAHASSPAHATARPRRCDVGHQRVRALELETARPRRPGTGASVGRSSDPRRGAARSRTVRSWSAAICSRVGRFHDGGGHGRVRAARAGRADPPLLCFRSGSSRCATSPSFAWRSRLIVLEPGEPLLGARRPSARAPS